VWKVKNESVTGNNTGNWNDLKIIHKISAQRTGKAIKQATTENSHTEHCKYREKVLI
jgi:hypothetical protein